MSQETVHGEEIGYFFLSLAQSSSSSVGAWRCRSRIFWYASGTACDLAAACSVSGNQVAIAGKTMMVTMQTHWTIMNFFFQAEDGVRLLTVTGVQTCALPI